MKSQLEQHYNAASLKQLGVPVLKKVKKKSLEKIIEWLDTDARVTVNYDDNTAEAVALAVSLGTKK